MGGIGKTVLAAALIHDPAIRENFVYGVAWLTFGRGTPVLAKAAELVAAITGQSTRFDSISAARGQLGQLTQDLALFVVLDDVWEPEAVDPFTGLGPRCRVLITTRDARVLARANATRQDVGLLTEAAAREFIAAASGLPNSDALPQQVDAIIGHCGRLPLALAAAGALIQTGTYSWSETLQALEVGATEEFDTSWLPDAQQQTLAVVLRVSVDSLPAEARECFLACAAFREDADIPEAALACLWSDIISNQRLAKRMCDELESRSLLIRDTQHRYRIHDLYVAFLHHAAKPLPARHAKLIQRYREACSARWDACPDDDYILKNLPWHLQQARQLEELRGLLFHFPWIAHKLIHTNADALIRDYDLLHDDQEAAVLAAAIGLSAHVLAREPRQLARQLQGRLVPAHGAMIKRLLDAVMPSCSLAPEFAPYLTPLGPNFAASRGIQARSTPSRCCRTDVVLSPLPMTRRCGSGTWRQEQSCAASRGTHARSTMSWCCKRAAGPFLPLMIGGCGCGTSRPGLSCATSRSV
jgi:hypothetical protein